MLELQTDCALYHGGEAMPAHRDYNPSGFKSEDRSQVGIGKKRATIARLEASAIELFARNGYEGTSLRDVATRADVALSTIDRHFGSKLQLFNAIHARIWKEMSAERQSLLRAPTSVDASDRPTLDAVLHALIHPVVKRAIDDEQGAPVVRLLREFNAMQIHMGLKNPPGQAAMAERFVVAFMQTCPNLTRNRAVWVLSFVISTMLSTQLLDGWLDESKPKGRVESVSEVTNMMSEFCRGGIRAVAQLTI